MLSGVLVLTKDVGIVFAFFLIVSFFIYEILINSAFSFKAFVPMFILGTTSVLAPKLLWNLSIKLNNTQVQFGEKIDFFSLINVLRGRESSYRREVLSNFYHRMWGYSNVSILGVPVLTILVLAFLFLLSVLIFRLYEKDQPAKSLAYKSIIFSLFLLTIVYIVGMCVMYMYKFSEYEAIRLASFDRYLGILLYTIWIFVFFSFVASFRFNSLDKAATPLALLCIVLLFVNVDSYKNYLSRSHVRASQEAMFTYDSVSFKIDHLTEAGSKIFIISQENTGIDNLIMNYMLMPRHVNDDISSSIGIPFYDGDIWTAQIDVYTWLDILKSNYDYVALLKTNDYFVDCFSEAFYDPELISDHTVFKVDKSNGMLEYIG